MGRPTPAPRTPAGARRTLIPTAGPWSFPTARAAQPSTAARWPCSSSGCSGLDTRAPGRLAALRSIRTRVSITGKRRNRREAAGEDLWEYLDALYEADETRVRARRGGPGCRAATPPGEASATPVPRPATVTASPALSPTTIAGSMCSWSRTWPQATGFPRQGYDVTQLLTVARSLTAPAGRPDRRRQPEKNQRIGARKRHLRRQMPGVSRLELASQLPRCRIRDRVSYRDPVTCGFRESAGPVRRLQSTQARQIPRSA
ncbi:hypothetical protein QBC98_003268 [Kitasatospora acidiphila]